MPAVPNTIERVLGQVILVGRDLCWRLEGKALDQGYARVSNGKGKQQPAHRYVYEKLISSIPARLTLDHLCRNRWCCHPNHVSPVTQQVNVLRGDTVVAKNANKLKCLRGHPLSGDNLRITDGRRCCRACHRLRVRDYKIRKARMS